MPAETPTPTLERLQSIRRAHIGNSSAILMEAQRRLRQSLPAWIEELNAIGNWDGRHSGLLPVKQEDIRLSPVVFDSSCKNSILLAPGDSETKGLASRVLEQNSALLIFSVEDVFKTDEQILRSLDRAEAAATVLSAYLTGAVDNNGVAVWKQMEYAGVDLLPPEIANGYAGAMATFRVKQTPHANGLPMP